MRESGEVVEAKEKSENMQNYLRKIYIIGQITLPFEDVHHHFGVFCVTNKKKMN